MFLELLLGEHLVALLLGDGGDLHVGRAQLLLHHLLEDVENRFDRLVDGDRLRENNR